MVGFLAVMHILIGVALGATILMHSGRDAGFGNLGFQSGSHGGTHIVEKNLTRLTTALAVLFFLTTIFLYRQLD